MVPCQNPGKGREGFLRFVFMITRNKNEMLALPRSAGAFVNEWPGWDGTRNRQEETGSKQEAHSLHGAKLDAFTAPPQALSPS